jgi:predicted ATPase
LVALGTTDAFVRSVRLERSKIPDLGRYPFNIPAIASLDELRLDPRLTLLVGENGSGKSTLLEAIAIAARFNPEGGTRNFSFATRPTESELHGHLKLVRGARREKAGFFLRAESFYNVATVGETVHESWAGVHDKSHGEAFLWLLENKFRPNGLYLLDEPEAALSPQRQLSALAIIHRLLGTGSQFVMATHSPILLAYPGALIYRLDDRGIAATSYEETEHYTITRSFLQNPARFFKNLFEEE